LKNDFTSTINAYIALPYGGIVLICNINRMIVSLNKFVAN